MPELSRALGDKDEAVRQAAAYGLSQIGPGAAGAVPALVKALGDKAEGVRESAALALAAVGPQAHEALPALLQAVRAGEPSVRRAAATTIVSSCLAPTRSCGTAVRRRCKRWSRQAVARGTAVR